MHPQLSNDMFEIIFDQYLRRMMDSKLREKLEIRNFHSGIWERAFKDDDFD